MNSYKLSVKEWVEKTHAIGLRAKAGRYGGTYAYKDIAFEFGMWISPEFKIYLIKEFERLKAEEMKQLGWDIKRNLAKINYRIHTDAIKVNEGRLLEQIFWTVPKVGPCFILKALLFKVFVVISYP